MFEHNDNEDFEGDELVAEDWPTYFTQIPTWILTSGISPQAYMIYGFLAEHINNRTPGKRTASPKMDAIARMIGLKKRQGVAKYMAELEEIKAVRKVEYRYCSGMRRGYRYIVRFNPPSSETGYPTLGQWYEANPDVRGEKILGRTKTALLDDSNPGGPSRSTTVRPAVFPGNPGGPSEGTSGRPARGTTEDAPEGTTGGLAEGTPELHQGEETKGETLSPAPPESALPRGERELRPVEEVADELLALFAEEKSGSSGGEGEAVALPGGGAVLEGEVLGWSAGRSDGWSAGWASEDDRDAPWNA